MRRGFALALLVGAVMVIALPALAGSISGDCVAEQISATSIGEDAAQLDSKTVASATRADPFRVDPDGSVSWNARTTSPITDHTWQIGLVVGGIRVTLFSGGDPNTAETQESTGTVSIQDRLETLGSTQASWAVDNLAGIYQVWGEITGDGECVDGEAWVLIDRSPLSGLVGQVAAGSTVAGLGLLAGAAVRRRGAA